MKAIWEFEIKPGATTVEMPIGARVISVQAQYEKPVIWAICDTGGVLIETREFVAIGTGWVRESFDGLEFIGTFQLNNGNLVFHLFEVK